MTDAAAQTLVQSVCNAVLCGSDERKAQAFFGLIHSNARTTGMGLLPCKGNYLALMDQLEGGGLAVTQEGSLDLPRALKLLKLSLKHQKARPRVVAITSGASASPCAALASVADCVGRFDCVYLRTEGGEAAEEEAALSSFCAEHLGNLVALDPFDSLAVSWQWREQLLSQLGISHEESAAAFASKRKASGEAVDAIAVGLLRSESAGVRSRPSMRMTESCRGESLDSYQHLSSDGFAHSWLPSYSNLARKYREKGLPQQFYLVILDTLCKWQTVFSCRAGRMVGGGGGRGGHGDILVPLKKRGTLSLLYSADADSWCLQWKQSEGALQAAGLPPLVSRQREAAALARENEYSARFTGLRKVRFEAVSCSTGQVLGVHLVSSLCRRKPAFFWLQEDFECEHGAGSEGLARKLEEVVRAKQAQSSGSGHGAGLDAEEEEEAKQTPLLALGSEKGLPFETVLLNLMSGDVSGTAGNREEGSMSVGHPSDDLLVASDGERTDALASHRIAEESALEHDLDRGFYSWTAQLDAELHRTEGDPSLPLPSNLHLQTSHSIGQPPPAAAGGQPADVPNDNEDSLLFELD